MPDYRRAYQPGGTFFFTLVTYERRPLFADPANVERLRSAVRAVMAERPFEFLAGVVLPDHAHYLWTLPTGDGDFSTRIGRMKVLFTRSLPPLSAARRRRRAASSRLPHQAPRRRRVAAPVLGTHDPRSGGSDPSPRLHPL